MRVISMSEYQGRKVADLLDAMLTMAQNGEIRALAFVAKFGQRAHRTGRIGEYRQNPAEALLAVQLLNQKLLEETDVEDL